MYPILLEIGDFVLPAWHTFFILGAIAAYILFVYLQRSFYPEIDERDLGNIYAFGYLGGYFGARVFSMFNEQGVSGVGEFFQQIVSLGPMTFYGGFLGVTCVVLVYCLVKKVPIGPIADAAMPAGLLGLAYGRVGCFLNGDDFGRPIVGEETWWSVQFPNLNDGIQRYPTQVIETLFCLLLVGTLIFAFKRFDMKRYPGLLGVVGAFAYALYRFFAEYLRGDEERGWWIQDVLSTSQGVSLVVMPVCFLLAFLVYKKARVHS